jgi:predicted LPLAT superfamily acyltransferase
MQYPGFPTVTTSDVLNLGEILNYLRAMKDTHNVNLNDTLISTSNAIINHVKEATSPNLQVKIIELLEKQNAILLETNDKILQLIQLISNRK